MTLETSPCHQPSIARSVGQIVAVCLALGLIVSSSVEAWQNTREPRGRRKSAGSAAPRKTAPAAPKSKKEADEKDEAEQQKKLHELKANMHLPRLAELQVPTVQQLRTSPVDWLVLKGLDKSADKVNKPVDNGRQMVIVVKQVFPRPDTLRKLQAALDELRTQPAGETAAERDKRAAQRKELSTLVVTLPGETEGELYEIPTNVIDYIIYHEDLIVRRAALLIDASKFREAYELLFALNRQARDWPGIREQTKRLEFLEGTRALEVGDPESALTSLTNLELEDRDYRGLQQRLGEAVDKLIIRSQEAGVYRESRHFLQRLSSLEPRHPIVEKWTRALGEEAQKLMESADASARAGRQAEAVSHIERAALVWPSAPGLREEHRRLSSRYQRLSVGVLDLPRAPVDGWISSPLLSLPENREKRLNQFDLFEVDRIDDTTHYRSRLIEQWEPTDLGRRANFTLKSTRSRWESRNRLTSTETLTAIEARMDRASPVYDERFASVVDGLHLRSPFDFEVHFTRAPPRIELLFRFPVTAANASQGERILSRRFARAGTTDSEAVFRRVLPEADGSTEYHVAEIVEHRYESPDRAIQGLMRGEISMLADLPPWAVSVVRNDQRFFVINYALPTTHVLQFNPQSEPLRSRELRLAMAYSIETPQLLSGVVLHDPSTQFGRPVTAPFATTSYAYNSLVAPREANLGMAASLHVAAVKRLKSEPVLRVVCDPGPLARPAMEQIIKGWKRVGIQAELVPAQPGAKWDVAYRTLRLEEPLADLWSFLTTGSGTRLEDLRHLPDWMREELLALDNVSDWKSVVTRLQQLQAHLFAEVECIPLWEVDDVIVLRKNIRDFPAVKFVNAYQNVERWIVQPWFSEDVP
jgi:Bacterial extracellular solute-binding proteins, family 5 Middle